MSDTPGTQNPKEPQNTEEPRGFDPRRLWSRKVHTLTPYVPGEQPRDRRFIKLNTNENPYPPSPDVLAALQQYPFERLKLYPDPTGQALRQTIADYYGLEPNQVFAGNGSDEVLAFAFQAFFNAWEGSGENKPTTAECIVFPDITYSFYPVYARLYQVPYRLVALAEDFSLPVEAISAPSAGVVLANPNAPTGRAIPLAEISQIAAADPHRLVLIDEAYVDFGADSAISLLGQFDNILVVQTCSKSRSLAGLRVGFAIGSPHLIEALQRVRDSFNSYTLDSLAQTCAIASFKDGAWFENNRARLIATREKTAQSLRELGFNVLPSQANFLFVTHPDYAGIDLYQALRQAGILVRHFNLPRIEQYLRISIGTPEEMAELVRALNEIWPGNSARTSARGSQ
jgi:histidinol-phosphate aminotransferase